MRGAVPGAFRALVVACVAVALITGCEAFFRLVWKTQLSGVAYDRVLGWRYVPRAALYDGTDPVGFNHMGFRDRDRSALPEPGKRRVLVLGDSYVAGLAVPQEKTLVAVAQRQLDQGAAPYELVPAAVSAWATDQELAFLSGDGLALRPAEVVVLLSPNDIRESFSRNLSAAAARVSRGARLAWWLSNHSALFQQGQLVFGSRVGTLFEIFRSIPVTFLLAPGRLAEDEDLFLRNPPPLLEAAYRGEEGLLTSIWRVCHQHEITLRLGVIPTQMEFNGTLSDPRFDPSRVREWARGFAAARKIPFIDLHAQWGPKPLENYLANEYHFNETGHRRAGVALATALVAQSR